MVIAAICLFVCGWRVNVPIYFKNCWSDLDTVFCIMNEILWRRLVESCYGKRTVGSARINVSKSPDSVLTFLVNTSSLGSFGLL